MKWWPKQTKERVRSAEMDSRLAEIQLRHVEARWPKVREVAGEARFHRELNGWTAAVKTIFGGK